MSRGRKANLFGSSEPHVRGQKFPPVMYGLRGICDMFAVSKATASRYANGILRDAVTKNGNVIVIDTENALRCFGIKNPRTFIKK